MDLQKNADSLSALIEEKAMDSVNIVRMMLDYESREIVTEKNNIPKILGSDIPGNIFMPYEDAGMTTGAYLAAQSLNYQTTRSADALRRAKKAFSAVCYIYELGRNGICEGFFPKPYGAKFSDHCSRDQYLFTMSGLVEYYNIANEDEECPFCYSTDGFKVIGQVSAYEEKSEDDSEDVEEEEVESDEDELEEERRLFYVAVTRAEKLLYLTSYENKAASFEARQSSFLKDIDEKLLNCVGNSRIGESFNTPEMLGKAELLLLALPLVSELVKLARGLL